MTLKAQIVEMIDFIPDRELPILLEVVRRFLPKDADAFVAEDDREAHRLAMQEYDRGETISHDEIPWE